jgi:sugar lactone lactonase YvrE
MILPMIPHHSVTNSLAFSPDGKVMYVADTFRELVWQVHIDPATAAIQGMREFLKLEPGTIGDGAAVDAEGGYWIAIFGRGEVRRYMPDGSLDRIIRTPFSQPTKPAFGGADLTTLYVTSGNLEHPSYERKGPNGALYAVETEVKGLPEEFLRD